jgi:translation initiation factor IF-3
MALPPRGGGRFNPRFNRQPEPEHRINERIRVLQVRLVGDNVTVGVYPTSEALKIAQEQELDLVEISPTADPPVCKVIDYKKFALHLEQMTMISTLKPNTLKTF